MHGRDRAEWRGKTTLIKTLIGREKPDSGEVKLGHKVQVGYHDQGLQSLDPGTTVVRAVWPEDDPDWAEGDVRNLLARFGLTGEMVFHTVGKLSGGEKAKAALARLCATSANLLVMDEPTNHLDIWSREALEHSINEFEGTVLVVSHDRYFLNKVADRLVILGGGQARVIPGDYETYQHLLKEKERATGTVQDPPPLSPRPSRDPVLNRPPCPRRPLRAASQGESTLTARPSTLNVKSAKLKRKPATRRPSRSARHLAQSRQGREISGPPHRAQDPTGNPVRTLGDRAGSRLVGQTPHRRGNCRHA